jgi:hypothetical protein
MTVIEALNNAMELLESLGYRTGEIHDDLHLAISRIQRKCSKVAQEEL